MEKRFVITGPTLLELWRIHRETPGGIFVQCPSFHTIDAPVGDPWIACQHALESFGCSRPYHVAVANANDRRRTDTTVSHLLKMIPPETQMYMVAPNLFAPSPEFCLLQMSRTLNFAQTLGLAYEFCGCYTRAECSKQDPRKLCEISSRERLEAYLRSCERMDGAKRARKAASRVLDRSYSVKETQLAMLLSLPRRQQGRGIEAPVLNHTIIPDSNTASHLSQDSYTVDFMWPSFSLILEYESKFHERKLEHDAHRRNELQFLGFKVMQATAADTRSAYNVAQLAMKIRNEMYGSCSISFAETTTADIRFHKEVMQLSIYP